MKALIVRDPWCEMILHGDKSMELRGSRTHIRGTIGLIKSGTGCIFGTVELVDCVRLTDAAFVSAISAHRFGEGREAIGYHDVYGWVLRHPKRYSTPKSYHHKPGCVIWVNL